MKDVKTGRKQPTLAAFGFTKSVVTSTGSNVRVHMDNYVECEDDEKGKTTGVVCPYCTGGSKRTFTSNQYLNHHITYKHPGHENIPKTAAETYNVLSTKKSSPLPNGKFCLDAENSSILTDTVKSEDHVKKTKRQSKRSSYTLYFKLKVLKDLENIAEDKAIKDKHKYIAEKYKIGKSMVWKWKKQKNELSAEAEKLQTKRSRMGTDSASTARTRRLLRKYRSKLYPLAEQTIVSEFRKQRAVGMKVSGRWFKIKMKKAVREFYGNEAADKFKGSNNWLRRFVKRNGIAIRRRTNKQKIGNSSKLPIIQSFHRQLRKDLNSKRRREGLVEFDQKWGRWPPNRRYNVDQVPCPFVINQDQTYEERGSTSVWISQPGSGLDKRQCTLQLCIQPQEPQKIPPAVIFRGKGNVSPIEKAAYHKNVHVYWQNNAWMDGVVAMDWIRNTFAPNVDKAVENVLFLDNLNCQVTGDFYKVCKEVASTLVYALPAEETDKCQPIDQGEGYLIKKLMGQELDKYLEQSDNLTKWQSSLTAGERRILITHWLGEAWETVGLNYPNYRKKLFEKTGLLMTVDGSEDHLIKPDGFDDYSF